MTIHIQKEKKKKKVATTKKKDEGSKKKEKEGNEEVDEVEEEEEKEGGGRIGRISSSVLKAEAGAKFLFFKKWTRKRKQDYFEKKKELEAKAVAFHFPTASKTLISRTAEVTVKKYKKRRERKNIIWEKQSV